MAGGLILAMSLAVYSQIAIPAEPSSGRSPGVPPILDRFMGAAVTHNSIVFRGRTDKAARLSFEVSANSDLSNSTITDEIITGPATHFTAEGSIEGLAADTEYFCMPLVNGERQYSVANCPRYTTHPTPNVDAEVTLLWGSCMDTPHEPQIFASMQSEGARQLFHLGDRRYIDSTLLVAQRTGYRAVYEPGSEFQIRLVERVPMRLMVDDHDGGANNIHGNAAGIENARQAFFEYTPGTFLDPERRHAAQSGVIANVAWFMVDVRFQRASSMPRFPGAGTNTAATGSSGDTLIIRASDSPSNGPNAYKGYYALIGGTDYRRVTSSTFNAGDGTHTCTLDRSSSALSGSASYFLKDASMLDKDKLSSHDQVSELLAWGAAATQRWKVILSPVAMNPSATGSDMWGNWDGEQMELQYILQALDDLAIDNLLVFSADRHGSGTNDRVGVMPPEGTASPFNSDNFALPGDWSEGKREVGHMYGRAILNATQAVISIRMADGTRASEIADLVVPAAA